MAAAGSECDWCDAFLIPIPELPHQMIVHVCFSLFLPRFYSNAWFGWIRFLQLYKLNTPYHWLGSIIPGEQYAIMFLGLSIRLLKLLHQREIYCKLTIIIRKSAFTLVSGSLYNNTLLRTYMYICVNNKMLALLLGRIWKWSLWKINSVKLEIHIISRTVLFPLTQWILELFAKKCVFGHFGGLWAGSRPN